MFRYFSLANITAGFVGVLVGFTSSAILVFQAATMAGADTAEVSSWLLALGIGIAATCIGLSLRYKVPVLTGWSTPGAALLITSLSGVSMAEAIGAFIFSAILTIFFGVTGLFEKAMEKIPRSLTSAMLAGILFNFGMNIFSAMQDQFVLVGGMFITYLLGKRFFPRYVIVMVLAYGIFITLWEGLFNFSTTTAIFSVPIYTAPQFTWTSIISVGLPLFIVTMTSQNITGTAVIHACGYNPPISPLITWTGIINLLLAPFGCYGVCLAAITAAICMGKEADLDPNKRYKATVFAGLCWIFIGLFGATVVTLFAAFPKPFILALAGLALISTIGNSLKVALEDDSHREPALITILVTASGFTLFGIGSACWGLLAGITASTFLHSGSKKLLLSKTT
ncbi:Inner membrane protein YdcO [Legionella adelaidensis]|uniref:Inner membrane protein YdcO n=1 Tax=Legionella adelaidensis TaxID=45056 RepID=A0A0W0R5X4_9GAMM|nr:benzoate/H(+) symporter BenE family transporter [Legionella adelaidensis]KTC66497.1 Inner membrane protein YdcO [Legionella adelaidensis]